jgi:hypothetical protein
VSPEDIEDLVAFSVWLTSHTVNSVIVGGDDTPAAYWTELPPEERGRAHVVARQLIEAWEGERAGLHRPEVPRA